MSDFWQLQQSASALEPLTLPGSRKFAFCYVAFFSGLILLGVFDLPFNPFLALGTIAFFGALLCMAVVTATPGKTYLAIDRESIGRVLLGQKKSVAWTSVTGIRAGWWGYETFAIRWNRQIFIDYHGDGRGDVMSFFPHQFGLNAEQALALLTPYVENARRTPVKRREAVAA
jgi:hypothetical protein